jgi:hypothetical protein
VADRNITDANIQMPVFGLKTASWWWRRHPDVVVGYLDQLFDADDHTYAGTPGIRLEFRLTVEKKNAAQATARPISSSRPERKREPVSRYDPPQSSDGGLPLKIPSFPSRGALKIIIIRLQAKPTSPSTVSITALPRPWRARTIPIPPPASECYMINTAANQIIVWDQRFSTYAVAYTPVLDGGLYGMTPPPVPSPAPAKGLPITWTAARRSLSASLWRKAARQSTSPKRAKPFYLPKNPKSFADLAGHWAASYGPVCRERESFLGTGDNLLPDAV